MDCSYTLRSGILLKAYYYIINVIDNDTILGDKFQIVLPWRYVIVGGPVSGNNQKLIWVLLLLLLNDVRDLFGHAETEQDCKAGCRETKEDRPSFRVRVFSPPGNPTLV